MKNEDNYKEFLSNTTHLEMDDDSRKKLFTKLKLIILCLLSLELLGGLLKFEGIMYNPFIIILYILEIISILIIANGLFTLTTYYKAMMDREIKKSINIFPAFTVILIILCIASFVGSIVFVLINGFNNDISYFAIYLLSKIAIGLLSYYFRYLTSDLEFKQDKSNE